MAHDSRLTSKDRRTILEQLTRDRLSELTTRLNLDVVDRRSTDTHIDAIVQKRSLDFSLVLDHLKREELQAACEALGLESGGREKGKLVERILACARPPTGAASSREDSAVEPVAPAVSLDAVATAPFVLTPTDTPGATRRTATAKRTKTNDPVGDYRFPEATRTNNPPAGLVEFDKPPPSRTKRYQFDPHLDPQLVWSGKAERTTFELDTVSLHIHERVSTQAILRTVQREDAQRSLFADNELPEGKQVEFYQHDVGWSNRLVLGDSLLVMNSLLERERMGGKVQCLYMDPPYGVKFNSNFQPSISRREVKDGDDASLTREPEQIQAYRDTWELGIHSYLTYMRDRLLLSRELLAESGSIFVQISDENLHHVRELLDEVFGPDNFVSIITFTKTAGQSSGGLASVSDYIVWYARSRAHMKYRQLFLEKAVGGEGSGEYIWLRLADGTERTMTDEERRDPASLPRNARVFRHAPMISQGFRQNTTVDYTFQGKVHHPGANSNWKTTVSGLDRLAAADRLVSSGRILKYKLFVDDFPAFPLTNNWRDTATGGSSSDPRVYVVQTVTRVIMRCILMTTDPGDVVLDPTCGSGTTATVAEQWGRRWITCDTSRVALALARQRLLTARFPYYRLRSERVRDGFAYRAVPHITLGSIANNARLDACKTREERERAIRGSADQEVLYDQPEEDKGRVRVSGPFTVEAIPVAASEHDTADSEGQTEEIAASQEGPIFDPANDFLGMMIDLVRKSGITFPAGRQLRFASIAAVKGPYEYLHAEGRSDAEGDPRRIAISFGPKHAPVTPVQVRDALNETRGYDWVIFVGFGCDPEARRMIDQGVHGRQLDFANAAPDILVAGAFDTPLLKTSKTTKLFTVFGAPDVKVHRESDGMISVEVVGVDLYDPVTGNTVHGKGEDVAAWFVDHEYDGRTFCICQALFPGRSTKSPWEKLQKALKGTIDEERFERLRSTRSLPFKPGRRVAVTVIDDRGHEVIKVVDVTRAR